jgi:hypothetical protein
MGYDHYIYIFIYMHQYNAWLINYYVTYNMVQRNRSCLVETRSGTSLDRGTENTRMGSEPTERLVPDIGSLPERTGGLHARPDPLE